MIAVPLYELEEGPSRKFYRIELDGMRVHLHWGRIDTEGEHQFLSFETEVEARAEYERQCSKRTAERGYRLVVDEGAPRNFEQHERDRLAKTGPLSDSPRFLFTHRKSKRFAWVEARGDSVLSATGLQVDEATTKPTTEPCGSPSAAIRMRDAMVAKWIAKGFELATFGAREPRLRRQTLKLHTNPELEAVVAEDPDDDQRWLVFEDWLLEQADDPRGELVRLEKTGERTDAAELRGRHLPLFLGPKHALIDRVTTGLVWRAGYIRECEFIEPKRSPDAALAALANSPATPFLTRLDMLLTVPARATALCNHLAQGSCVRTLRRLAIGTRWEANAQIELDACALLPFERLERLRLGHPEWRQVPGRLHNVHELKSLRTLEIAFDSGSELAQFLASPLAITELALDLAGAEGALADLLAPLFAGESAPAVRHLRLTLRFEAVRSIIDRLRESALLAQLQHLSFGGSKLAPPLLPGFEHLESLELPPGVL